MTATTTTDPSERLLRAFAEIDASLKADVIDVDRTAPEWLNVPIRLFQYVTVSAMTVRQLDDKALRLMVWKKTVDCLLSIASGMIARCQGYRELFEIDGLPCPLSEKTRRLLGDVYALFWRYEHDDNDNRDAEGRDPG